MTADRPRLRDATHKTRTANTNIDVPATLKRYSRASGRSINAIGNISAYRTRGKIPNRLVSTLVTLALLGASALESATGESLPILTAPVQVDAEMSADTADIVVHGPERDYRFRTVLFGSPEAQADILKHSAIWRSPYLFIDTGDGSNRYDASQEAVFRLANRRLRLLGSLVGSRGKSVVPGTKRFIDQWMSADYGVWGVCHACEPLFPVVLVEAGSGLKVVGAESWSINRRMWREEHHMRVTILRDPAWRSPDQDALFDVQMRYYQSAVRSAALAKFCNRAAALEIVLRETRPHLSPKLSDMLDQGLKSIIPLQPPSETRRTGALAEQ